MIASTGLLLAIGGKGVEKVAEPGGFSMKLPDDPAAPLGQPEEVAGLAVYLASPAATYVTGQTFFVDGGWLAR